MIPLKVSVITPVYNAEKYLENAVNSALFHDCVKEVILVEDNSPDNALEICKKLEAQHNRVKLYRHPNGENRGAGASRNLGIEKATCDYIAFLDADDWYETNRFDAEIKLLKKNINIDGVYGATGFYNENEKKIDLNKITSFNTVVSPENLLHELTRNNGGRFTTDAVTLKKSLLKSLGAFDTSLKLHQDSHLWVRLAYYGKLESGIIDTPIAYRRVHNENRIAHSSRLTELPCHVKLLDEFKTKNNVEPTILRKLFINVIVNKSESNSNIKRMWYSIIELLKYPPLCFKLFK